MSDLRKPPKLPQYAHYSRRLETFRNWSNSNVKPEMLAKAGFVYSGREDKVTCINCGGGLRNWEKGDDPWREHERHYGTNCLQKETLLASCDENTKCLPYNINI